MPLTPLERKLVKRSLADFTDYVARQPNPALVKVHFYKDIVPWLAAARGCSMTPRVSAAVHQRVRALIASPDFDASKAAECFNIVRSDLLNPHTTVAVTVVRCPLAKEAPGDAAACERAALQPGADACIGRYYYAKTDSRTHTVWMAEKLFSSACTRGGAEFLTVGDITVSSLTEFVIMHEVSHLIYNGDARIFERTNELYKEALTLIPRELLASGHIYQEANGDLEFSANTFAYENTRSDLDERSEC
jgi:hypothetical protein